jgi:hypothetical protein
MKNLSRVVAGALLSVSLVACGSAETPLGVAAGKTSSPTAAVPGQATPPSTAGAPSPVAPPPVAGQLTGNRSDKGTALGRVCWVEREVALAKGELLGASLVAEGGPPPDEERAANATARLKTLVATLPAELGSADGLPSTVLPFRARLIAGAGEARPIIDALPAQAPAAKRLEILDALSAVLNFEQFPGVREFAAAARADRASCPDL